MGKNTGLGEVGNGDHVEKRGPRWPTAHQHEASIQDAGIRGDEQTQDCVPGYDEPSRWDERARRKACGQTGGSKAAQIKLGLRRGI